MSALRACQLPGLSPPLPCCRGVPLLSELSCGREVIAMENRGAGDSIDYSTAPLTYYTMADSVLQLADALKLTQPDVLGWSSGGDIALVLAAQHGAKVGRVIALAAMAGSNNTGERLCQADLVAILQVEALQQEAGCPAAH